MKISFIILALLFSASSAMAQSCARPTAGPPYTSVPLDIATVTTGGTAVTALAACNAIAPGAWIVTANAAGMCIDQFTTAGTATGVPSTTTCVGTNQPFFLTPSIKAVSVNSTASGVLISGQGSK